MDQITVDAIDSLAVGTGATAYSKSKRIASVSALALLVKASVDAGTPNIALYLEQGPGLPVGAVGGGEGEAGNATDAWTVIGNKLIDLTDENWHAITLSPVVLPFLRIKAVGAGNNPASGALQFKLGKQESLS